jgi:hypothetical protein
MMNSFDNEAIIPRVVEKTPAFAGRSQLGENVLVSERDLQGRHR